MFHTFLKDQLKKPNDATFILVGEDHLNSSALIGLAHNKKLFKDTAKQVLIFSESLPRLRNPKREDKPYTIEDVNAALPDGDNDKDAILALIQNGAKIYGVESEATAPGMHLTATTKEALYGEAQTKMPYLFANPEFKKQIDRAYDETMDDFKFVINSVYAASDERITIPNKEFTEQMIAVMEGEKKPVVCIFAGGAAHIPETINDETDELIDKGIQARLQENGFVVRSCFVNDDTSAKKTYTPADNSGHCRHGEIHRFQIESSFRLTSLESSLRNVAPPTAIDKVQDVKPGDILLFKPKTKKTFIQNTIKTLQSIIPTSRGNNYTIHAGICVAKDENGLPIVAHLVGAGYKQFIMDEEYATRPFAAYRPKNTEAAVALANLASQEAQPTSFKYNVARFVSAIGRKRINRTKHPIDPAKARKISNNTFCSLFVIEAMKAAWKANFRDIYPDFKSAISPKQLEHFLSKDNRFEKMCFVGEGAFHRLSYLIENNLEKIDKKSKGKTTLLDEYLLLKVAISNDLSLKNDMERCILLLNEAKVFIKKNTGFSIIAPKAYRELKDLAKQLGINKRALRQAEKRHVNLPIEQQIFKDDLAANAERKPLLLGCSGGGGHNAAIEAIRQYLDADAKANGKKLVLPQYNPVLHNEKPAENKQKSKIEFAQKLMYHKIIGEPLQKVMEKTRFPLLPSPQDLDSEVAKLNASQLDAEQKNKKSRAYVDMLLDVYPSGYENAAIWNVLQKADKTEELKKLIALQKSSDQDNYNVIKKDLISRLIDANDSGKPYTEVISTQAMSLPALCDAVKYYNDNVKPKPPLRIHQYMTDLPTEGAVHFFNSLKKLTPDQRKQMYLYGVNLTRSALNYFNLTPNSFAGVFDIDPTNNPMARKGFKDKKLETYLDFTKEHTLKVQTAAGKPDEEYEIAANEKIASVMLGSQASTDTIKYVEELVKKGYKVFVFGGKAEHIKKGLDAIDATYQSLIIPLGNQDDAHIAPLMTRSNVVVMRGGGLSVMEQLGMPHNASQTLYVHTKEEKGELTSGISWEDENVNSMMINLKNRFGIKVERTTIDLISDQLAAETHHVFVKEEPQSVVSNLAKIEKERAVAEVREALDVERSQIEILEKAEKLPILPEPIALENEATRLNELNRLIERIRLCYNMDDIASLDKEIQNYKDKIWTDHTKTLPTPSATPHILIDKNAIAAEANLQGKEGNTLLHALVQKMAEMQQLKRIKEENHLEKIALDLIRNYGANLLIKNHDKKTPLDYHDQFKFTSTFQLQDAVKDSRNKLERIDTARAVRRTWSDSIKNKLESETIANAEDEIINVEKKFQQEIEKQLQLVEDYETHHAPHHHAHGLPYGKSSTTNIMHDLLNIDELSHHLPPVPALPRSPEEDKKKRVTNVDAIIKAIKMCNTFDEVNKLNTQIYDFKHESFTTHQKATGIPDIYDIDRKAVSDDINTSGSDGKTILHVLAQKLTRMQPISTKRSDFLKDIIAELIKEGGADALCRDRQGNTPIDYCPEVFYIAVKNLKEAQVASLKRTENIEHRKASLSDKLKEELLAKEKTHLLHLQKQLAAITALTEGKTTKERLNDKDEDREGAGGKYRHNH